MPQPRTLCICTVTWPLFPTSRCTTPSQPGHRAGKKVSLRVERSMWGPPAALCRVRLRASCDGPGRGADGTARSTFWNRRDQAHVDPRLERAERGGRLGREHDIVQFEERAQDSGPENEIGFGPVADRVLDEDCVGPGEEAMNDRRVDEQRDHVFALLHVTQRSEVFAG